MTKINFYYGVIGLSLLVLLVVQPSAFGLHLGKEHTDPWSPPGIGLSGCPCPTGWISYSTNNPTINSGREKLAATLSWHEGYDDEDLRIRTPGDTTNYYAVGVPPQVSEIIWVDNPPAGAWDVFYRTWSISSLDDSGATFGTFRISAFEMNFT